MEYYRIEKPFLDHVVGSLVEFDEEEAKGLLMAGAISTTIVDENIMEYQKAAEAKLAKIADAAAEAGAKRAIEGATASLTGMKIAIGETKEEKLAKTGGFKSMHHFVVDVYKAGCPDGAPSTELKAWRKVAGEMSESDNAQGGFLVPEEFKDELLKNSLEASIVRQRARVIPMQTNRVNIPAINVTSHASTRYGGVDIKRTGEGDQKIKSKPALRQISLNLSKLTGLIYVSDELLEDSPISVSALINEVFPEAISYQADDDYLNGNGAGQPLGAINAANPCLVAVAKEAAQPADTIVFENIIKMWARLYPPSQSKAVWLANNDCFPQLAAMNMSVGAGGVPVWMPANGVSGSPYASLMGRPLIMTEKCQTLGDQADIALCDFSQYFIGQKAGGAIKAATSIHLRFDYDQTAFRFVMRHDGQPSWNSALTPKNSTNTVSPFVVLAERA